MSVMDYLNNFFEFFNTQEKLHRAPPKTEEFDFFAWLFGVEEPPQRPVVENPYFGGIFSVRDSYDYSVDEVLKFYGPEEAEKVVQRLHINVCLAPFIATLLLLTFVCAFTLAYKNGKPFVIGLTRLLQRIIQDESDNKGLEMRMNVMESMLANNMKEQENSCLEGLKSRMGDLIESQSRVLVSTQARLGDITGAVQDLLQASIPVKRCSARKGQASTGDIGDSKDCSNIKA